MPWQTGSGARWRSTNAKCWCEESTCRGIMQQWNRLQGQLGQGRPTLAQQAALKSAAEEARQEMRRTSAAMGELTCLLDAP